MANKKFRFRILRFKSEHIDPARFQEFTLDTKPDSSILDALEKIRLEQDNTLMFRHSCHHSSCGTCACNINGREGLTCITKIQDLETSTIILTPLESFKPIGDLVVDMTRFYKDVGEDWSYLRKSEKIKSTLQPAGISRFSRFENCIECGACMSACPVTDSNIGFLGPAVLAAVNNELKKSPQKEAALLSLAGNERGAHLCERALNCSRVCPTGVYPARHIADLRRRLQEKIGRRRSFSDEFNKALIPEEVLSNTTDLMIRPAAESDIPIIYALIKELADYERLSHQVVATQEDIGNSLFGERPFAEALIGENDGHVVSFALFFYNFSTFMGRPGIYLEDLYVKSQYRSMGFGRKMLIHIARLAKERNCVRFEWSVLDWNTAAIRTYEKLNATPMKDWILYRLCGEALDTLANED